MRNIPKYISNLTIDRDEVVDRLHYYMGLQEDLRKTVRSYKNVNDAPNEIRRQIYENRILLNHYSNRLKEINKKIHLLNLKWQGMLS